MIKGTREGREEEESLVIAMNSKKAHKFWKVLGIKNAEKYCVIHVSGKKWSTVRGMRVNPKSDCFLAEGCIPSYLIKEKGFYLDESDVAKFKLEKIKSSGISIKRKDSSKYTISKMNPSTFKKVFGNTELGAGSAIYCTKPSELAKNDAVVEGWLTDWPSFENFFKKIKGVGSLKDKETDPATRLVVAKKIKEHSNAKIKEMIESSEEISDFIFRGTNDFEQPYSANWFYENDEMKKAGPIPFVVTTGSGRSHGDFTIVVKPK